MNDICYPYYMTTIRKGKKNEQTFFYFNRDCRNFSVHYWRGILSTRETKTAHQKSMGKIPHQPRFDKEESLKKRLATRY